MLPRLSTGTFKLEIVENDIQKVTMVLDVAAMLCGFYAIYHVIFLKFRREQ